MGEADLVAQIRAMSGPGKSRAIIRSIGDDCAVLRPPAGRDLVFTTDFVLEGRHFTLATHSAADIGHKALARSLSDLAAMGAEPLFCLVSLGVTGALADKFVPNFYKGFLALADEHSISLAGGDLAKFDHVVVDVMCCGSVPKGKAFLRSAARVGDAIYVTGLLGDSAHGFRNKRGVAWARHKRPTPRVSVGVALRKFGIACAMDISDGLSLDLARLCVESKVSAELLSPLPVAKGATLQDALHGGEDYELLFTAARGKKIPPEVDGIKVTKIGVITKHGNELIRLDGQPLAQEGFDHFR